jgi:acyl dehydratase
LTLSLAPGLLYPLLPARDGGMGINYGLNRVRFPAPVPVGSRVRMHVDVAGIDEIENGEQMTLTLTFEREGQEKPVCVAEAVFRFYRI